MSNVSPDRPVAPLSAEPGQLPRLAIPSHYRLHLQPDLANGNFCGSVSIALQVVVPTSELVLHAVGLDVTRSILDEHVQAHATTDTTAETLTLSFAEPIAPGDHHLAIDFAGTMETVPVGLHIQRYLDAGQSKAMIATQFEPADARRMFPLWDEPAYRATFELSADVPAEFEAISNMPIVRTEALARSTKRISFAPTPKMPSYLLVFCAGELSSIARRIADV
ncbi:MAG: M1 family peptidase, partial [Cyanobacteria bacterium REEB65]|nr:M1 family peptidase [Cyanobacteria bacterium REEB65]